MLLPKEFEGSEAKELTWPCVGVSPKVGPYRNPFEYFVIFRGWWVPIIQGDVGKLPYTPYPEP